MRNESLILKLSNNSNMRKLALIKKMQLLSGEKHQKANYQ